MLLKGALRKMHAEYHTPIRYYLNLGDEFIDMNQLISKRISLEHVGNQCKSCGLDKRIYRMGFCRDCFFTVPEANINILKPELSTAHLGQAQRDLEWEKKFELQTHYVYLAVSGALKVGVTRKGQIPTRWMDQGASSAIVLAETENRYEAGMIEVALKENLSDKTNWRKMLVNENPNIDLVQTKLEICDNLSEEHLGKYCSDNEIWEFEYPVLEYPKKVKTVSLAKKMKLEGVLTGIRGQYLYFENAEVFNVRAHEGYVVDWEF